MPSYLEGFAELPFNLNTFIGYIKDNGSQRVSLVRELAESYGFEVCVRFIFIPALCSQSFPLQLLPIKPHLFLNPYIRSRPWVGIAGLEVWFTDDELDVDFSIEVFVFCFLLYRFSMAAQPIRCRAHMINLQVKEQLRQSQEARQHHGI